MNAKEIVGARRWAEKLRYRGVSWALRAAANRLAPARLPESAEWANRFSGARALEIGGPSPAFERSGLLPIYDRLGSCDNVQFSTTTQWQGFVPGGAELSRGHQVVSEASDLSGVADGEYALLLASHVLEHLANPLSALREWRRAVRTEGDLVVVVPEGRKMWDYRRPVTRLAHLQDDELRATSENDMTHLGEVLELSDPTWFEEPWRREDYLRDFRRNAITRAMHHHVFDPSLLSAALTHSRWHIRVLHSVWPFHLVAIASSA